MSLHGVDIPPHLREWEPRMDYFVRRFQVPGKLDSEEVVQECLITLTELSAKYSSEELQKVAPVLLYRKFIDTARIIFSEGKDHRIERPLSDRVMLEETPSNVVHDNFYWLTPVESPVDRASYNEKLRMCIAKIKRMSEEHLELFTLLENPPPDLEGLRERYRCECGSNVRRRNSIPFWAWYLNKPQARVMHLLQDIRLVVSRIFVSKRFSI